MLKQTPDSNIESPLFQAYPRFYTGLVTQGPQPKLTYNLRQIPIIHQTIQHPSIIKPEETHARSKMLFNIKV